MYSEEINLFLELMKSVIHKTTVTGIEKKHLPKLYLLAQRQGLIHMVALALKSNQMLGEEPLSERFQKSIRKALLRQEVFVAEEQQIYRQFENAKISYVPLKGAVIRQYYREPWLRTSGDIDILVKEEDLGLAKELLTSSLGYEIIKNNYHDISMRTPSNVIVELHFSITENEEGMDLILGKVWEYVHPTEENSCRYDMEPEYLFFHVVAHMLYHFKHGGCGVRFLLDIWTLKEMLTLDMQVVKGWFAACGMEVFAEYVMRLSDIWFGQDTHDEVSLAMQTYILEGGLYGTSQSKVMAEKAKTNGDAAYMLQRIFQPFRELAAANPKLRKYPWLYPYYTICRWIKMLNVKEAKKAKEELRISKEMKADSVEELTELFQKLNVL